MDLENFVAQTLVQITKGIQKAQNEVVNTGAWINPAGYGLPNIKGIEISPNVYAYVHNIEFDVVITASDEQKAEGGAGIKVFSASLKAGGGVTYGSEEVSRVKFSLPVVWPQDVREKREKDGQAALDVPPKRKGTGY